jgi:hypothetical protein
MVIDHEFTPTRCTKCGKQFTEENTEQFESPFSELTGGGTEWNPEDRE